MKILIVSDITSNPVDAGNKQAIMTQVSYFKSLGHEVFYLYVDYRAYEGVDEQIKLMQVQWKDHLFVYQTQLQRIKVKILNKIHRLFNIESYSCDEFYPWGLANYINKLYYHYHFDICIVNYYWLTRAFKKIHIPKKVLMTHDCFTYKNIKTGHDWMSTTPKEEGKAMQRADYILALQTDEATYFSYLAPNSTVLNIYNFYNYTFQPITFTKNILFLSGSNPHNIDGITWFIENIFPTIKKEFPSVKLIVGGSICKKIEHKYNEENIIYKGYVDDIAAFYSLGDVVINPTRNGTGLKIKTFEALSFGKVTLVHPHSAKGIFNKSSAPLFSSEKSEEWVGFLSKVWSQNGFLGKIKRDDQDYIESMDNFIKSEYDKMFI